MAVNRPQFTLLIRPVVPDSNSILIQVTDVRVPCQKPEQLVNNRFRVKFLGRHKGKTTFQIKTHLVSKDASDSGPGTIFLLSSAVENLVQQLQINLHRKNSRYVGGKHRLSRDAG